MQKLKTRRKRQNPPPRRPTPQRYYSLPALTTRMEGKMTLMAAERDRIRTQRDTFSIQFEELTKIRWEGDGLYEKYKSKAELQAKTQNDIIASQTALTEKLQAKVKALEKALSASVTSKADGSGEVPAAGGVFVGQSGSGKVDPKEVKALKDELAKLKAESKGKDEKIAQITREYKAEVEHSRTLQASSSGKGTSAAPTQSIGDFSATPEEAAKDAKSLALYEDLTLLNIANVKIKSTKNGDETTFNCILSLDGQSLNFKLRCYTEIDKTRTPPYVKTVHYIPEQSTLQNEPASFVKRLDYFATEFVIPRDQLGGFFMELRAKMSPEDEE
ncbi:hypothetical protein I316_05820 [Kwoniella heveanensis BCC8398]|uniref:Monopolin complex subunit Csm1/Pcs1 C-terminal domain-containing protein n=1 Tax=Kwoniella heveanensis BCC8398 TaxID=1296120 RepID=A0A1B9GNG4_9TREE|nr:hypothetical protein I316_05820 [Kwoniella heveanensis BCC8398]